jgi:NAD-dependent dihydropyrimidine dehydrogenase PreA subunit
MAFVVTDACVGVKDAGCMDVCPVDCIHPMPNTPAFAVADQVYIDPTSCISCALCVAECPAKAIFRQNDLPKGKQHFVDINAEWFLRNRPPR